MDLTVLYPQLFRRGHFKVQCQKNTQPRLLSEAQARERSPAHVLQFPPTAVGDVQPEWYGCDNPDYPFAGFKKNEGAILPLLPCCFKTDQRAKNAVKLRQLAGTETVSSDERDIRRDNRIHKEHIIKHPGQFGDLPPT